MSAFCNVHLCGNNAKVEIRRGGAEFVFVIVQDGEARVTMSPQHVRALAAALDAWEAANMVPEEAE